MRPASTLGHGTGRIFKMSVVWVLLLAFVGSFAFCTYSFGLMSGVPHEVGHEAGSPSPVHLEHLQALKSATLLQSGLLSVVLATLSVVAIYTVSMFLRSRLLVPPLSYYRCRKWPDALSADRLELRWFSRFVRSPEFLLPA